MFRCTDCSARWLTAPENRVGSAPRFLVSFSRISPHFRPPRHRMTATDHRTDMAVRFQVWDQVTEQAYAV
ncbi:hypothetical protein R3Q06_33185 [Rhodococcus erythropolis]|uniref:hypothetical protein n=1 Tax=Rhodococcus erythropolis TaxID=1833 RepID=UPI002949BB12|nr:hypothetical protein [Rhodococcus erythropolis]MDV6278300.1 hypothetical protein [Rhodococcus erythropolis]